MRELGAPEGGTLGGSNNMILMVLAFLVVFGLGCAAILLVPNFAQRWRDLDDADHEHDDAAYPPAEHHHEFGASSTLAPNCPPHPVDVHAEPHLSHGDTPHEPFGPHPAPSR